MMTRDERLRYWEKIEAAQAQLCDPESAAEYQQASQAWDSKVGANDPGDRPGRVDGTRSAIGARPA